MSTNSVGNSASNLAAMIQELRSENEQLRASMQQLQGGTSMKALPPQSFDGNPRALQSFITQVRQYHKANEGQLKYWGEKVANASSYLKGDALHWFEPFIRDYSTHTKKEDMKQATQDIYAGMNAFEEAIKGAFGDVDEERQNERKILQLKQTGPATKYATEFRLLASRLDWTESALMARFYEGLKDAVKDDLIREDRPETLTEYIAMAVKIDDRQYERRIEKGRKPAIGPWNPRIPHHRSNQGRKYQHDKPRVSTAWGQTTHAGPMELDNTRHGKPKDLKDMKCYNCGKNGHMARECRQPKKPWKPVNERQLNHTQHQDHAKTNWTFCYQDDCLTHKDRLMNDTEWDEYTRASEEESPLGQTQPHMPMQAYEVSSASEDYDPLVPWNELIYYGTKPWKASTRKRESTKENVRLMVGDHPALHHAHEQHYQLFWPECVYDDCEYHFKEKAAHRFLPRNHWIEPRVKVEFGQESRKWILHMDEYSQGRLTFRPDPAYHDKCYQDNARWEDCDNDACMKHYIAKARDWRLHRMKDVRKPLFRVHYKSDEMNDNSDGPSMTWPPTTPPSSGKGKRRSNRDNDRRRK
ncbi:hypothetical protein BJF96_g10405 [Verticillium dahliae]|uniref:CCHC-type domain-containing protein n=1 Tax=Verticillium dahliae TaxID=27337 RepID=A0AA44W9C5_VERDA|nr:hypothetical protein BJF96_g10405 [Verticillium dahliae]